MLASHLIFSTHGFWLPNDPRGSWSTHVRHYELYLAAGPATKIGTRQSVAKAPHDPTARRHAKDSLKHPPVLLSRDQARWVVSAIKQATAESTYRIHALAVMPDHLHAIVAAHGNPPNRIVGHWKARCTQALLAAGLHPFAAYRYGNGRYPEFWAHQSWTVYLDTAAEVERAIVYVNNNPIRAGMRPQRYTFLTPFHDTGVAR